MTSEQKKEFGVALKNARTEKHLTQRECAQHCGLSTVAVQNWEHGTSAPKNKAMDAICELLGIDKKGFV